MNSSVVTVPPASLGVRFGVLGALLGFLGVAAGAFGTHALRGTLPPVLMSSFETASRYQLIHAVALLVVALAIERISSRGLVIAGVMFVSGIILFSGSLYALALTGQRIFGLVTPLGGVCLLVGWLGLAAGFAGRRRETA